MLFTRRSRLPEHARPTRTAVVEAAELRRRIRRAQAIQAEGGGRWIGRLLWAALAAFAASLLAAVLAGSSLRVQAGPEWWRNPGDTLLALAAWVDGGLILISMLLLVDHSLFALNTLRLAAGMLARERETRTDDLIRLTPVTAAERVRGKWRAAVLPYLRPSCALVAARAGLLMLWLLCYAFSEDWQPPGLLLLMPVLWWVMLALRALAGGYVAAVGVLASAWSRSEGGAARLAIALFTGMQILLIGLNVAANSLARVMFAGTRGGLGAEPPQIALLSVTAPLDGGLSLLLNGLNAGSLVGALGVWALGLLICAALFGGLTWGMLRLAAAGVERE